MRTAPRARTRPGMVLESALLALLAWSAACTGSDVASLEEDPVEDPCQVTPSIGMGQSQGGVLEGTDCRRNGVATDRWELELSSRTVVQVDLTSQMFDPLLELQRMNGSVIAVNDDWGGYNSRIIHDLAPGSYILAVRGFDPSAAGAYTVSVQEGPDCSPVAQVSPGSSVDGTLAAGDCLVEFGGLVDWYSLDLEETRKLRLDVQGAFDEVVLLADVDGHIFNGADWNHPVGHARLDEVVQAGSWLVGVASLHESSAGSYTLSVQDAPPCSPGGDLTLGESLEGTLSGSDCSFEGWTAADSVGLNLDGPTDLSILAKSPDTEPLVIVRDSAGMDVAVAYPYTSPGVAETRVSLPAGRYAVFITSASWPATGSYTLTVDQIVCDETGSLEFGTSASGTLDTTDCPDADGRYRDLWSFGLDAETAVQLDMKSTSFDAFLILEDSLGNEVARNDDGGAGSDARLSVTLQAGSYRVVATSFAPWTTGDYSLSAGAPSASAVAAPELNAGSMNSKASVSGGAGPSDALRMILERIHPAARSGPAAALLSPPRKY